MTMKDKLEFGQTPWDNLSEDELRGVSEIMLTLIREIVPFLVGYRRESWKTNYIFWGTDGVGGQSVSKIQQALRRAEQITPDSSSAAVLLSVLTMYNASRAVRSVFLMSELDQLWQESFEGDYQQATRHTQGYVTDDTYHMFFRYATDLLFRGRKRNWVVCPRCGEMTGSNSNRSGEKCSGFHQPGCIGTYRELGWGDLNRPEFSQLE